MKKLKEIIEEYESPTGLAIEDMDDLGFGDYVNKISDFYTKKAICEETASELFDKVVRIAFYNENVISDQRDDIVKERLSLIDMTLDNAETVYKFNKKYN